MNANRILYRSRQLWQALGVTLASEDLELVHTVLTPAQLVLFDRLQPSEKAHSIQVLRALMDQDESHPDLFIAALLHDVGKSRFPLKLWQRVLIVLVKSFTPGWVKRWGSEPTFINSGRRGLLTEAVSKSWRQPFIVAARHPAWGAEMAAEAGASPLAVALIRLHQDELETVPTQRMSTQDSLLRKLQSVDDNS